MGRDAEIASLGMALLSGGLSFVPGCQGISLVLLLASLDALVVAHCNYGKATDFQRQADAHMDEYNRIQGKLEIENARLNDLQVKSLRIKNESYEDDLLEERLKRKEKWRQTKLEFAKGKLVEVKSTLERFEKDIDVALRAQVGTDMEKAKYTFPFRSSLEGGSNPPDPDRIVPRPTTKLECHREWFK